MNMRTQEEKQAWKDKMNAIARSVREMPDEKRQELATKLGTVTCEGRKLSPYNTIALWMQAQKALLQVGGYRQWQRIGRIVKKGEHSPGCIFVPMTSRKGGEPGTGDVEVSEPGEKKRVRFRLVPVFDVSQTEENTQQVNSY